MTRTLSIASVLLALSAIPTVAARAPAQAIPLASASPGGHAIVVVQESTGVGSTVLSGVTFEPLTLAGYAQRQRLRLDRPSAVTGPGLPDHVRLPQGGSLYRVRHDGKVALLHVAADGNVSLAHSVAAVAGDPTVLPQVSVSPDGAAAVVATTLAAGGDVVRLDLVAGTSRALTGTLPPLPVAGESLRVGGDFTWFVAGNALYRADGGPGDAQAVPFAPLAGPSLLPEIAMSRDGRAVAFVIEDLAGRRLLASVDPAGIAGLVASTRSDYDTPGYADPTGPFLALSDDGALVAYRRTVTTRELFVRDVAAGAAPNQLTADANFIDTIDNVGVIGFAGLRRLLFAAGEVAAPGPLAVVDAADIYAANISPGGAVTFQNMTQTSGVVTAPFVAPGQLEILEVTEDPLGQRLLLIADPSGSGDAALHSMPVDGSSPATSLLPTLDGLPSLLPLGDDVLVLSPHPGGGGGHATDVHLLRPAGSAAEFTLLGTAPSGVTVDRTSGSAALGVGTFVASAGPDLELAFRMDLDSGFVAPVWFDWLGLAPATAISPSGRVIVGLGFTGGPFLFAGFDAPMVGTVLDAPITDGFPLTH